MRPWVVMLTAVLGFFAVLPEASATLFRRPFDGAHALGSGFDNDGGAGGCRDYECGGYCYDGHGGSDYPMVVGTRILAGADGTVDRVVNGCADYGYLGNSCGDYCGNYVRIRHDDGAASLYCHLQLDSIRVANGARVTCGTHLGNSASSGSSTGPHLHFGTRPDGRTNTDPYRGSCSGSRSQWVDQRAYTVLPGTDCERSCECDAGTTQSRDCGRCGSQTRRCGADCTWGGWGDCGGQGECDVGDTQSEPCCDCGTRARTCSGSCSWGDWGGCSGPDPEPKECAAPGVGVCALGVERCIDGCLGCAAAYEPSTEVCDGLDNDCDGVVDNDAHEFGVDGPPAFAAEFVDFGFPRTIRAGDQSPAWILVRNAGASAWADGDVWLTTRAVEEGRPSPLQDRESWPAWDVAAVVDTALAPGETALIEFSISAGQAEGTLEETFELTDPAGAPIRCPDASLSVLVEANGSVSVADREPTHLPRPERSADVGLEPAPGSGQGRAQRRTGCGSSPPTPLPPAAVLLIVGALSTRRRKR